MVWCHSMGQCYYNQHFLLEPWDTNVGIHYNCRIHHKCHFIISGIPMLETFSIVSIPMGTMFLRHFSFCGAILPSRHWSRWCRWSCCRPPRRCRRRGAVSRSPACASPGRGRSPPGPLQGRWMRLGWGDEGLRVGFRVGLCWILGDLRWWCWWIRGDWLSSDGCLLANWCLLMVILMDIHD